MSFFQRKFQLCPLGNHTKLKNIIQAFSQYQIKKFLHLQFINEWMNELITDGQTPALLFVVKMYVVSGKRIIRKCPYFDVSVGQDFVKVLCSVPPHGLLSEHILSP